MVCRCVQSTEIGMNFCLYIFKGRSLLELGGNNAIIGKVAFFVCLFSG